MAENEVIKKNEILAMSIKLTMQSSGDMWLVVCNVDKTGDNAGNQIRQPDKDKNNYFIGTDNELAGRPKTMYVNGKIVATDEIEAVFNDAQRIVIQDIGRGFESFMKRVKKAIEGEEIGKRGA